MRRKTRRCLGSRLGRASTHPGFTEPAAELWRIVQQRLFVQRSIATFGLGSPWMGDR